MESRYRRVVSGLFYALIAVAFAFAAVTSHDANLLIWAGVSLVFAMLRLSAYISLRGSLLCENTWPKTCIQVDKVAKCRYRYIAVLGTKNFRLFSFIVESNQLGVGTPKKIGIPRLGYLAVTRRALFTELGQWLQDSRVELDERTASILTRLKA
jgi:hypothetical protein